MHRESRFGRLGLGLGLDAEPKMTTGHRGVLRGPCDAGLMARGERLLAAAVKAVPNALDGEHDEIEHPAEDEVEEAGLFNFLHGGAR